jgi:uncharacterized membrane protein
MGTGRLEAFSDGVIAIIITITIMVLELKAPHGAGFDALLPIIPVFLSYVLIFWRDSSLARAFGKDFKGRISVVIYAVGIGASLWQPSLALAIYVSVAIMWIIPDRRIEK